MTLTAAAGPACLLLLTNFLGLKNALPVETKGSPYDRLHSDAQVSRAKGTVMYVKQFQS